MKRLFCVRAVVVNNGNERAEETLGALWAWIFEIGVLGWVVRAHVLGFKREHGGDSRGGAWWRPEV